MNQQQLEKSFLHPKGYLEVHSVFYTIQGEGPFTGHAAVFVRLAGCNLQCPACDTDYTSSRYSVSPNTVLALVQDQASKGLVVITGGEPFRQDIEMLVRLLLLKGYFVQVETNGTLAPGFTGVFSKDTTRRDCAFIVCSPKTTKINPALESEACAFKYVIKAGAYRDEDGLPTEALDHPCKTHVHRPPSTFKGPVYIQPLDEKDSRLNYVNTQAAVRSCQRFGHVLQLQIHKILEVD
jgi:organic radical activating enzyme